MRVSLSKPAHGWDKPIRLRGVLVYAALGRAGMAHSTDHWCWLLLLLLRLGRHLDDARHGCYTSGEATSNTTASHATNESMSAAAAAAAANSCPSRGGPAAGHSARCQPDCHASSVR